MDSTSGIDSIQRDAGAAFMAYGAPGGDGNDPGAAVRIVESFGEYEAEYAAIRKGVGIFHLPQRGLLRLTGADRRDFLHRLLTQDVNAMAPGRSQRAFQLNQKGRILADVIVHHGDADTWLEMDRFDVPALRELYDGRLFGEDVMLEDISDDRTMLALHGPAAGPLLASLCDADEAQRVLDGAGTHHVVTLAGGKATACRRDTCGVTGVQLFVPAEHAAPVYQALAEAVGGLAPDVDGGVTRPIAGRGIGWLAQNTARVEAGCAIYHIDFGPDCLPHEVGTDAVSEAVSFTKGCYLGQEIVTRMHNRGHPKRVLVGLKCGDDRMPVAGSQVYSSDGGAVIGAVTSSTVSPMLGNVAIALAMVQWDAREQGVEVRVPAEGGMVEAAVQGGRFL